MERTLQMMIETCADIANHIVSDKGNADGVCRHIQRAAGECRYRSGPERDDEKNGKIQERRCPSV